MNELLISIESLFLEVYNTLGSNEYDKEAKQTYDIFVELMEDEELDCIILSSNDIGELLLAYSLLKDIIIDYFKGTISLNFYKEQLIKFCKGYIKN